MALDRLNEYPTPFAACQALAPQLNVGVETLRKWVIQAQVDAGTRTGPTSVELEGIKQLKKENRDLKTINEVAGVESGDDFLREGARPSPPLIVRVIEEKRGEGHSSRADL